MNSLNFIVAKTKQNGRGLILIRKMINLQSLQCSTRMTVPPELWDKTLKRVRDCYVTHENGLVNINPVLDKIENYWNDIYHKELLKGKPNFRRLKANLNSMIKRYKSKPIDFDKELAASKIRRKELSPSYLIQRGKRWGFTREDLKNNPEILLTIRELINIKRLCKSQTSNNLGTA